MVGQTFVGEDLSLNLRGQVINPFLSNSVRLASTSPLPSFDF